MFFVVRKCVRISVSKYLWRNAVGNLLSKGIEAEEQRTGRNKETSINHTYIEGGEFRKKFDSISDDKELNKLIYTLAKQMLIHRSGTLYEDMYWDGYNDYEAQIKAINELQKNFDIIFKEVVAL